MIIRVKLFIFRTVMKVLGLLLALSAPVSAFAVQDRYEQKVERYQNSWNRLIPRYQKLQFAGAMGVFSLGISGKAIFCSVIYPVSMEITDI